MTEQRGAYIRLLYEDIIDSDFGIIKTHLKLSEAALKSEKENLSSEYNEMLKNAPAEDTDFEGQLEAHFIDRAMEYSELDDILWNTVFLYCFAVLEAKMTQLCEHHEEDGGHLIKLKDLMGKGICRARLYLKKVAGVPDGSFENWEEIVIAGKVRNYILHNGSKVKEQDLKSLQSFEIKYGTLTINDNNYLNLSKEFCERNIEISKNLLIKLHGELLK